MPNESKSADLETIARALADRLTTAIEVDIRIGDDDVPRVEIMGAEAMIRAALQAVRDETRRETLREAISAANNEQIKGCLSSADIHRNWGIALAADAIRALITEPVAHD